MTGVGSRRDRDAPHCYAVSYDDQVTTSSAGPVVLRNGADIEDPLTVVLAFLKAPRRLDVRGPSRLGSFGEPDLRLANRGGARISTAQIAAINATWTATGRRCERSGMTSPGAVTGSPRCRSSTC